jgi:hypothetical protein
MFFSGLIDIGNSHILIPELQFALRALAMGLEFPLPAPSPDSGRMDFQKPSGFIYRQHRHNNLTLPAKPGRVLPGLHAYFLRRQEMPEPVVEYRVRPGIRQNFIFDILIVPLILGQLFAIFIEYHYHVVFNPYDSFNHVLAPHSNVP